MSKTRNNQMTVRFSQVEAEFLAWYAKHIYVENANAPRHVLGTFMTDHPELVTLFYEAKKKETARALTEVLEDNDMELLDDRVTGEELMEVYGD